ncbi:MAG: hypothetical protein ACQETH_08860 [Candidatus Rifleibacteriota bacterium]
MNANFNYKIIILFIFVFVSPIVFASQWLSRAELDVVATGTVNSFLEPELHKSFIDENGQIVNNCLDLSLFGPDSQPRALELYWRESGDQSLIRIKADKTEWEKDNQLLWQADVPKNHLISGIQVNLPYAPPAAKMEFQIFYDNRWHSVATGAAILRSSPQQLTGIVRIETEEKVVEKIRLRFSGFDEKFSQTPISSVDVYVKGRRGGKGYKNLTNFLSYDVINRENADELRINLPGTSIFIEELIVETSAMFKGKWRVGTEKFVLGRPEFNEILSGGFETMRQDPQNVGIPVNRTWKSRKLILQLSPADHYGKIVSISARFRLPRIVFSADISGRYRLETGLNKNQKILEFASVLEGRAPMQVKSGEVEHNSDYEAESVLKDISLAGGPFSADGYKWKADVNVDKPGFYQLELSSRVFFDNYLDSLRIVKDQQQIPYFRGRYYKRDYRLNYKKEFDAQKNHSIFYIDFPSGKRNPDRLKIKTSGIFDRDVTLYKHTAGKVGWQVFKRLNLRNEKNEEIVIDLSLKDFPQNQKRIKIVIDNGNNYSLPLESIVAEINVRDLYFIASGSGKYQLYGGDKNAERPSYDLKMIQDKLAELFPEKVSHSDLIYFNGSETKTSPAVAMKPEGAPFKGQGYRWVGSFTMPVAGLCQLKLNHEAALDNHRDSIRIVKNGNQIPYFLGKPYNEAFALSFEQSYDREKNITTYNIHLPVASKFYKSLSFNLPGTFQRSIKVNLPKPGNLGWREWKTMIWKGENPNNSFLLSLKNLPVGENQLQLVVMHNENSPVVVTAVNAVYSTQDLFFKASQPGSYLIYGGNSNAEKPEYDLELVRDELLTKEPRKIALKEINTYSEPAVKQNIKDAFSEKGWGLYFVMGLVTLILLIIIYRIFPAAEDNMEEDENSDKEK